MASFDDLDRLIEFKTTRPADYEEIISNRTGANREAPNFVETKNGHWVFVQNVGGGSGVGIGSTVGGEGYTPHFPDGPTQQGPLGSESSGYKGEKPPNPYIKPHYPEGPQPKTPDIQDFPADFGGPPKPNPYIKPQYPEVPQPKVPEKDSEPPPPNPYIQPQPPEVDGPNPKQPTVVYEKQLQDILEIIEKQKNKEEKKDDDGVTAETIKEWFEKKAYNSLVSYILKHLVGLSGGVVSLVLKLFQSTEISIDQNATLGVTAQMPLFDSKGKVIGVLRITQDIQGNVSIVVMSTNPNPNGGYFKVLKDAKQLSDAVKELQEHAKNDTPAPAPPPTPKPQPTNPEDKPDKEPPAKTPTDKKDDKKQDDQKDKQEDKGDEPPPPGKGPPVHWG